MQRRSFAWGSVFAELVYDPIIAIFPLLSHQLWETVLTPWTAEKEVRKAANSAGDDGLRVRIAREKRPEVGRFGALLCLWGIGAD